MAFLLKLLEIHIAFHCTLWSRWAVPQSAWAALGEAMGRCRLLDFPRLRLCPAEGLCSWGSATSVGRVSKERAVSWGISFSKIISLGMSRFLVYSISPQNGFPCGRAFSFSFFSRGKDFPISGKRSLAEREKGVFLGKDDIQQSPHRDVASVSVQSCFFTFPC